MYHRIVAMKVRRVFAEIGAGNSEAMVSGMAPTFTYRFYGDHALAGTRHTHEALRRWWSRCYRLLPDVTFDVREVLVKGWPWSTTVATRIKVSGPLPDGSTYTNDVMQFMHMKWAKVDEVHTLEDTAVVERALDIVYSSGVEEAHAAPITDAERPSSVGSRA
jgi:ketosteroid isomerase-like protein